MARTQVNLDEQAVAQTFSFGTTSASGDATVTINNGTASDTNVVLDVKGSQNIAGDLNLTGNLNITGSIDEQTVTNLAVKDLTIRTNKGGTTTGAAGAGLQVEGDSAATIGAITYNGSSATKFQIGDGTTQNDIVDTSSTQTLTNKSIAGSQISGDITGNAGTATKLKTARTINGTSFDGSANVTVTADATTLTGTSLKSTVVGSSLTSVGTIATGTWNGTTIAIAHGGTGATTAASAITALLPDQSSANNKVLTSDGTSASWQTPSTGSTFTRTTITGTINGTNASFSLGATPNPTGSEQIIQNGIILNPGSGNDYTISGATVTFATAPASGDVLQAFCAS